MDNDPRQDKSERREQRLIAALREIQSSRVTPENSNPLRIAKKFPEIAQELIDCLDCLAIIDLATGNAGMPESATRMLAGYRLLRPIGRGGMGTVFEAEQIATGERVAIKVLNPYGDDDQRIKRFQLEAQAAALLKHPHIVPVISVDSDNDAWFCVMPFIDGCSLDVAIDCIRTERNPVELTVDESPRTNADQMTHPPGAPIPNQAPNQIFMIVRLFIQAADALHYAHEKNVVHRDIKPSNLILDSVGKLWITDFGLASWPDTVSLTRSRELLGTLRYMSPEQLQTSHGPVDHRTDIYSLGATLYELLALQPAVSADSPALIQLAIERGGVIRLRRRCPDIPLPLERIVSKAMSVERGDRYQSAAEFSADLNRFLLGQPVVARPPGLIARSRRMIRNHPGAAMTATAALLVLVAVSTIVAIQFYHQLSAKTAALTEAQSQRSLAQFREMELIAARDRAEQNLGDAVKAVNDHFLLVAAEPALQNRELWELRSRLVSSALPFLEKLKNREPGSSFVIDETTAEARFRFGAILLELWEYEKAVPELIKAAQLFGVLHRQKPENHLFASSRLRAIGGAARAFVELGDFERADDCYREMLDLQEAYIQQAPCKGTLGDLVRGDIRIQLAAFNLSRRDYQAAELDSRQAIEWKRKFFFMDMLNDSWPTMGDCWSLRGRVLAKLGRDPEAISCFNTAIASLEKLSTPATQHRAALTRVFLAEVLLNDDPDCALRLCHEALAILAAGDESQRSAEQWNELIGSYSVTALALVKLDQTFEAKENLALAESMLEKWQSTGHLPPRQQWSQDVFAKARDLAASH